MLKDKKTIKKLYSLIQEDLSKEIIKTERYKEISKESNELYEQLKNKITEDEYDLFSDFVDKYTEQMVVEIEEYFVEGFSMANQFRDESLMR